MRRWLPHPLLSAGLLALWLLLNPSVGWGNLMLGAGLAVLAPLVTRPLRPRPPGGRPGRPWVAVRLLGVVALDMVMSNLQVARVLLRAGRQSPRSAFLAVPLDLRSVQGLAALSIITTFIPGTVWCELAPDGSRLLLHVFDVDDEVGFITHYKQRYEAPLRSIFEGAP